MLSGCKAQPEEQTAGGRKAASSKRRLRCEEALSPAFCLLPTAFFLLISFGIVKLDHL